MKFKDILEKFETIEVQLKLDESLIKNIYWWDMVRYPLFEEIFAKTSLKKQAPETMQKFFFIRIMNRLYYILKSFFLILSPKSPIWIKKGTNVIWGHPRRKFENGFYTDIYSDPFIDLFSSKVDFSVIERNDNNFHYKPFSKNNVFYGENLLSLAYLLQIFKFYKLSAEEELIVQKLQKLVFEKFSCEIDIKKMIINKIRSWEGIYPLMKYFFKIKRPNNLIIVVSAGNEPIISAAKSENITTFELQHGSPTRGKLNYDYSSGIKKKSFPDWFLSFGSYWTTGFELPIKKEKIISIGYSYLNKKIEELSSIKKENRLVIISQPRYADELAELAIDISKKYSNKIIVEFKPHPIEYNDTNKIIYFQKLKLSGVFVSSKNSDLYEIFAKSRWQVGVYSTALYEGLCFDCSCFLFNVPRAEHTKKLIDENLARMISTAKDIDLEWKVSKKNMLQYFDLPKKNKIDFLETLFNSK